MNVHLDRVWHLRVFGHSVLQTSVRLLKSLIHFELRYSIKSWTVLISPAWLFVEKPKEWTEFYEQNPRCIYLYLKKRMIKNYSIFSSTLSHFKEGKMHYF